ncbi:MAG: chitobiase/beta-hexosaminidase C-terminal domain-containing protein [Lachnospiraceae bacterium]|nr:chitobiase/beta-hexosaminidase C-terminal domain-containing protein [Lachnospiraceae bacterium]
MKCPKCGFEMGDGKLYCEKCGNEIRIVPDFEPEIENSIIETLTTVAVETEDFHEEEPLVEEKSAGESLLKRLTTRQWNIIIGFLTAIITLTIAVSLYAYFSNSVSFRIQTAQRQAADNRYEDAISNLDKAHSLEPENTDVLLLQAEYYLALEDEATCIQLLEQVAVSETASLNARNNAYGALVTLYEGHQDFEAISDALMSCEETDILNNYKKYLAKPPEFNYIEGSYDTVIPLKLSDVGEGTIYYTTDGRKPSESSSVYGTPIFLENGNYRVRAIFVNQFGVASDVVEKNYHIEITVPTAPEVNVYSGDYDKATLITADAADDCTIYYTRDGSEPTNASNEYVGPIPMPLGDSTLRFVAYSENGIPSEITERTFHLVLNTSLRVAQAITKVCDYQILVGKILDYEGHTPDNNGVYVYQLHYCIPVPDLGDYYMIYEYYTDPAGKKTRTGNIYAVSLEDSTISKATYERDGTYIIEAIDAVPATNSIITESIGAE